MSGILCTLTTDLDSEAPLTSDSLSGSITEDGSCLLTVEEGLEDGATNTEVVIGFDGDTIQSLFLLATQNTTVLVNSIGSPALTIDLLAGSPLVWSKSSDYYPNPFLGIAVTALYLTCNASTDFVAAVLVIPDDATSGFGMGGFGDGGFG